MIANPAPAAGSMMTIEAMDRLSINDKIAHFARRDAFRLPKKPGQTWGASKRLKRASLPCKLGPGSLDATGGNVTRQAYPVIGRPCFGIPTARLVHGREHMIRKNGKLAFARCGECPIKAACQFIVQERLNADERIREAHREFQRRGGAEAFWSNEPSTSRAPGAALHALVRELQAAGFTSVNDSALAKHYDELAQTRREAAAERQRKHRQPSTTEPANDQKEQARDLVAEGIELRKAIETAQKQVDCPRWLHRLNAADVARVWAIRVALARRGEKHGATHIASALAPAMSEVGDDAVRFRVTRILKRMHLIEALQQSALNSS